ncbi:MAG: AmmeMemoRadiSam system protein A [Eubacterium sp.]|nr:AmmeMemoRadiSam system protein A [Eubacterium sp.]
MSIIASFMVPHPPLIVPQVGRGSEAQVQKTIDSYLKVADEIAQLKPETIIISSPHATMYADYFHISPGEIAVGSFADFGAPQVKFTEEYDTELVEAIEAIAQDDDFPAGTMGQRKRELDHGTMVPLHFIRQRYSHFKIVRIGLSGLALTDHYVLGQIIQQAVNETGRRVVYVASGDLSHKLQEYGPYGFALEGPEYDERIMDVCSRGAFGELFDFDDTFCDKAAECGHRSFVMMAGALDGLDVDIETLSHEDVTGVGYGICTFHVKHDVDGNPVEDDSRRFLDIYLEAERKKQLVKKAESDAFVRLARKSLETYIMNGKTISVAEGLQGFSDEEVEMLTSTQAGAFVSIHEHGLLRGCIGTILPTEASVAAEIIHNAISASTRDPRFDPIGTYEIPYLEINVDVLGKPEPIDSKDELDVKRYGVIVSCGSRRGLLLPDLDGVDTVDEQIAIAMKKGGINPSDDYKLERFEVVRHV